MIVDAGGFPPEIYSLEDLAFFTRELINDNLEIFEAQGYATDLREYPIRYEAEPTGTNYFQDVNDIITTGLADCEDLASWLVAWFLYNKVPAYPVFEQQSPTLYHVVVRAQIGTNKTWLRLDPSRWFGMGR